MAEPVVSEWNEISRQLATFRRKNAVFDIGIITGHAVGTVFGVTLRVSDLVHNVSGLYRLNSSGAQDSTLSGLCCLRSHRVPPIAACRLDRNRGNDATHVCV